MSLCRMHDDKQQNTIKKEKKKKKYRKEITLRLLGSTMPSTISTIYYREVFLILTSKPKGRLSGFLLKMTSS